MRKETVQRAGIGKSRVANQEFMKKGGSTTPVPDDKNRGHHPGTGNTVAIEALLDHPQDRVKGSPEGDCDHHRKPEQVQLKTVTGEQGKPVGKEHPVPETRAPEGVTIGFFLPLRQRVTSHDPGMGGW